MAEITLELITQLREQTGAGIMDAKAALKDADGDYDKALAIIAEKAGTKAGKRAERETGAGLIETYVHNGRVGVMLDMRAETDFVVRSEPFQDLAKDVVMHIAAMKPEDVEELLTQPFVKNDEKTVGDLLNELIAKTGENCRIAKFARFEA